MSCEDYKGNATHSHAQRTADYIRSGLEKNHSEKSLNVCPDGPSAFGIHEPHIGDFFFDLSQQY